MNPVKFEVATVELKTSPKKDTKEKSAKKRTFLKRGSSQKYDPLQAAKTKESKQYRYYADNFDGVQPKTPVHADVDEKPVEVRKVTAPEIIKTTVQPMTDPHPTFEEVKKTS